MIKDNRIAFLSTLSLMCTGFLVVLGAVFGQQSGQLSPMVFMVLLGLGLYIPYVAFHTTLFERMLAAFRETGTIGYLMYLADAFGYLGLCRGYDFSKYGFGREWLPGSGQLGLCRNFDRLHAYRRRACDLLLEGVPAKQNSLRKSFMRVHENVGSYVIGGV